MAKVKLSAFVWRIRGSLGDVVFKRHGKETIITRKATHEHTEWSLLQILHRLRFKTGIEYGRYAMAVPELYAAYRAVARKRKIGSNCLAIGDYWNPPEVESVEIGGYWGRPGDVIDIVATDDFGVVGLEVEITGEDGRLIEKGEAVESRGVWKYTVTTEVPEATRVRILARAVDRPGGIGEMAIETVVESPPPLPKQPQGKYDRGRGGRSHARPAVPALKLVFPEDPECVFRRRVAAWEQNGVIRTAPRPL